MVGALNESYYFFTVPLTLCFYNPMALSTWKGKYRNFICPIQSVSVAGLHLIYKRNLLIIFEGYIIFSWWRKETCINNYTLSIWLVCGRSCIVTLKKKTQSKQWSKQMKGKKLLGGSGKSGKNGVFSWSLSAFVNWEFLKGCLAFQDKFPNPVN